MSRTASATGDSLLFQIFFEDGSMTGLMGYAFTWNGGTQFHVLDVESGKWLTFNHVKRVITGISTFEDISGQPERCIGDRRLLRDSDAN